jgi:hypothetical protein
MSVPKTDALPLGDAPIAPFGALHRKSWKTNMFAKCGCPRGSKELCGWQAKSSPLLPHLFRAIPLHWLTKYDHRSKEQSE